MKKFLLLIVLTPMLVHAQWTKKDERRALSLTQSICIIPESYPGQDIRDILRLYIKKYLEAEGFKVVDCYTTEDAALGYSWTPGGLPTGAMDIFITSGVSRSGTVYISPHLTSGRLFLWLQSNRIVINLYGHNIGIEAYRSDGVTLDRSLKTLVKVIRKAKKKSN